MHRHVIKLIVFLTSYHILDNVTGRVTGASRCRSSSESKRVAGASRKHLAEVLGMYLLLPVYSKNIFYKYKEYVVIYLDHMLNWSYNPYGF
jgi:hypothetical protein